MGDFIGVGILFAIAIIQYLNSRRKSKSKLLAAIRHAYGRASNNEFDQRDYNSFSQFFKAYGKDTATHFIDDITWNDLEMDRIYSAINNTWTSFGDEALYNILRIPEYSRDSIERRLKMVDYWDKHQEERERTLLILAGTGKQKVYQGSILAKDNHYIDIKDKRFYKILPFIPLVAALTLFINVYLGIILVCISVGINFIYHEYTAKQINKGIDAVMQAASLVNLAGKLIKNKPVGLEEQFEKINDLYSILNPITEKGSPVRYIFPSESDMPDPSIIVKIIFLIDIWSYQASIDFLRNNRDNFAKLFLAVGEVDATISIASYRKSVVDWSLPDILWDSKDSVFDINAQNVKHPLIKECTPNEVYSVKPTLLTGSNASGKSTYLKTVAVNTLLAHTIGIVHAKRWISVPLFPITSMALRDNILNGESYFVAEIKSLKRIFAVAKGEIKCLCVIDEILRGTNTIERIASSSRLLRELASLNTCILAATHDQELTNILRDCYENKHFEETITDNDILFDYKLKEGKATSRNAIKLLRMIGFDNAVVEDAEKAVSVFEESKRWDAIG